MNYAAAKSGIHDLTKALIQEDARHNITVNAIAPGYFNTDMIAAVPVNLLYKIVAKMPVIRLCQADAIARGVISFAADDAKFVRGSIILINGRKHMT